MYSHSRCERNSALFPDPHMQSGNCEDMVSFQIVWRFEHHTYVQMSSAFEYNVGALRKEELRHKCVELRTQGER